MTFKKIEVITRDAEGFFRRALIILLTPTAPTVFRILPGVD
jgi:hypothetical protein